VFLPSSPLLLRNWTCSNLTSGSRCTTPCKTGYTGPGFTSPCSFGSYGAVSGSCSPNSEMPFRCLNIQLPAALSAGLAMLVLMCQLHAGHVADAASCIQGKSRTLCVPTYMLRVMQLMPHLAAKSAVHKAMGGWGSFKLNHRQPSAHACLLLHYLAGDAYLAISTGWLFHLQHHEHKSSSDAPRVPSHCSAVCVCGPCMHVVKLTLCADAGDGVYDVMPPTDCTGAPSSNLVL